MELVQILKALGDENRIRILNILNDAELCVGEIEHILGMSQSNVSRHLTKLFNLKIVIFGKKAQWVFYKLNQSILGEYPFIKSLIDTELSKIEQCQKDMEKLTCYKESGMSCEQLKECKELLESKRL
ncbi:ArsR/SmtB family transcription factor [Clostridium manihotivorum]|uniref:ArsR family transcriptional regulator n=1 Tax=Clostridium manihotivorum TaxID=2320868 RepID=A0A3R5QYT2_9CLOT|nr:metalloregulator ArsR/SmtB family transcription factor [Clostridium manihotivorum]QAA32772.1 ArsR family transcriptional regulator [Clostridium manihotivorum]